MARRLHKTLVDYLVIAVSPALIMTLIGSLIYFLLEVFYRGQHGTRIHWILTCFIIGSVLVGRISIEEGKERAAAFAVPLALVTLLAIKRFVILEGVPFSFLINCGLVALIWWCAHRLTWDCTLIDEDQPDSGEGLLEAIGLDEPATRAAPSGDRPQRARARRGSPDPAETADRQVSSEPGRPSVGPVARSGDRPQRAGDRPQRVARSGDRPQRQGSPKTASRPVPAESEGGTSREAPPEDWRELLARAWTRIYQRSRRPHAPGLWVVYFSLAALPLFGLGQLFVPSGDLARRQYVFDLLCVYVASGLGLLLSTSFLGLRRYLRQRRLEMPVKMVGVWLVMGCLLIVAVMAVVMVLPRPNAEYAVSRLPVTIGSPERSSSRYGVGNDGVQENKPWARADKLDEKGPLQSDRPGEKGQTPAGPADGKSTAKSDSRSQAEKSPSARQQSQGQSPSEDQRKEEGGDSKPSKSEGAAASPSSKPPTESGKQSPPKGSQAGGAQPDAEKKEKGGQRRSASQQPSGDSRQPNKATQEPTQGSSDQPPKEKPPPGEGRDEKPPEARPPKAKPSNRAPSKPLSLPKLSVSFDGWLAALGKLLLYAVLAVVIGVWLWRHREEVLAAIRDFASAWRRFWASLFGGKKTTAELPAGEEPTPPQEPRFADFVDPFLAGTADRQSPAELVNYTFQALEAWAREHACGRKPDETPHELAWNVAQQVPDLTDHVRRLADLYCRVAYAPGAVPPSALEQLRQFWQSIPQEPAVMDSPR